MNSSNYTNKYSSQGRAQTGAQVNYVQAGAQQDQVQPSQPVRKKRLERGYMDYSLIFAVIFLTCIGIIMVYSITSFSTSGSSSTEGLFLKQAIISAVSVIFMIVVSYIPYDRLIKYLPIAGIILALVLMILVNYTSLGQVVNGRKRWLAIGPVSFQPTEYVKVAVIVFLSAFITKHKKIVQKRNFYIWLLAAIGLPIYFVADNNLSSGIIIVLITFVMLYVASENKKYFIMALVFVVAAILVAYFFGDVFVKVGILKEYQYDRILVWKDPAAVSEDGGYQVLQGLYAIGSGGFFGKGLGNSTQKISSLPEAQNDMIFSVICEELGIFGAICIIALFVFLIYRMIKIAKRVRNTRGFYYVVGVITHISLQVILHIAVVTNLIPNTGVSLPFISQGGSSILFLMIEVGIVLSIGKNPDEKNDEEVLEEKRRRAEYKRMVAAQNYGQTASRPRNR